MKTVPVILSIFLLLPLLLSCEFESDKEFFRTIDEPGEIFVGIDLSGVRPGDPIYIYDDTKLYYTLSTSGKKLLTNEVVINGSTKYMTSGEHFTIFKDDLNKTGENTLKFTFKLKTGSGSLADIMDAEFYEGEFVFKLIRVDNVPELIISDGITDEGYFKLKWAKPSFEQLEVEGYEISFKNFKGENKVVNLDGSATEFVDEDYVAGYRAYSVKMKFADGKIGDKTSYYNMSYSPITSDDISFEFEDLEYTKIIWKQNKYRCKYFILHNRNDKAVGTASFETPQALLQAPVFPEESGFYTVIVAPYSFEETDISYQSGGVEKFYEYAADSGELDMAIDGYSVEEKLIYGRSGNTIHIGDATTLKNRKSFNSSYFDNLTSVSVSPNSNKMLVFIGYNGGYDIDNQIYLYNDKGNLVGEPAKVVIPKKNSRYLRVELVDDDLIFIANSHDTDGVHSYHSLINSGTGEVIQTIETNLYNNFDISYNRKRFILTNRSGFSVDVFEIGETGFELLKTVPLKDFYDPDDLLFCKINPADPNQVIFWSSVSKEFQVLDVETGESVAVQGGFENIDPFTGRIYCFDADWNSNYLMNVYNHTNLEEPVLSFRSFNYGLSAYNNFISMYFSCINISKHFTL